MNIHDYLQQASQINQTLVRDPQTLLALTVAWLDPLAILKDQEILADEDISDYYYSGDTMGEGLYVTRRCFPDIYARAISKLRIGIPFHKVLSFIDDEIERQTKIPTSQFEEGHAYAFGIPLPWYGIEIEDPDFLNDYEDEWHLIQLFGISIDDNESDHYLTTLDMPENIWLVAYVLRWSLWAYRHSPLHETLMHAISYVFSCSGNSSVDYSYDMGIEFQPLQWIPDDVEFAQFICQEAEDIMLGAATGLANAYDPAIQGILLAKIALASQLVQKRLEKGLKIHDDTFINHETPNPFDIRWDDLRASPNDETESDLAELSLRMGTA